MFFYDQEMSSKKSNNGHSSCSKFMNLSTSSSCISCISIKELSEIPSLIASFSLCSKMFLCSPSKTREICVCTLWLLTNCLMNALLSFNSLAKMQTSLFLTWCWFLFFKSRAIFDHSKGCSRHSSNILMSSSQLHPFLFKCYIALS